MPANRVLCSAEIPGQITRFCVYLERGMSVAAIFPRLVKFDVKKLKSFTKETGIRAGIMFSNLNSRPRP